ncbi:translesion DNA synthesis-associated protein ImuA [Thauera butanivorans]|uniref:translesion DNA synthesis-associated protein ImuA n=1 Tax=Thauera butanivorans TaxID=86174 RepID=UPI003AB252B4
MAQLLENLPAGLVWQGSHLARPPGGILPTGFPVLDAELPGGGWPAGALIELLAEHPGVGELSLLLPLMRKAGAERWIACIAPPLLPYAPALAAAGVPLQRLLLIQPASAAEALWAARQATASGACALVLAWLARPDTAALRRLQLAAEESATPLFLFRTRDMARHASPAPLRLALAPTTGGLRIDILKRRGPPAARPVLLSWRDDTAATNDACAGTARRLALVG